jgi:hypothetical protein
MLSRPEPRVPPQRLHFLDILVHSVGRPARLIRPPLAAMAGRESDGVQGASTDGAGRYRRRGTICGCSPERQTKSQRGMTLSGITP